MSVRTILCLTVVFTSNVLHGAENWKIEATVVDQSGEPVVDFVAATFWSANGKQWQDDGTFKPLRTAEDRTKHWSNEGVISPSPLAIASRQADGCFTLEVDQARPAITVFVTDSKLHVGAYRSFEKDATDSPAKIVLKPLIRVTGRITCEEAGITPELTMAIVHPPGDFGNYKHFTRCGSTSGKFSFLLPPGEYDLHVYGRHPESRMAKPHERDDEPNDMPPYLSGVRIAIPDHEPELDLGTLDLRLTPAGKLESDLAKGLRKEPPAFRFADARGISKDVQLTDLRGKWVLLDFWHFGCGPCLNRCLPELMEFYEVHKERRDRFEIVSVCEDIDGTIKTMKDVDRAMEPIVESIWKGRTPSFPITIDDGGRTIASFGVGRFPTLLLFDPDGNLVDVGLRSPLEVLESNLD